MIAMLANPGVAPGPSQVICWYYSLNVKRVKKTSECQFTRKRVKATQKKLLSTRKREKREKKSEIFHSKKSEKRVKVNTSEHHSKMYCPPFKSLKSGHSLAESELHSFSSE